MRTTDIHLPVVVPVATLAVLFLVSCTSVDQTRDATPDNVGFNQPKSATAIAQKELALLYLGKVEKLLIQIDDPEMRRQTSLAIAYTHALLGEQETGKRFLTPAPALPDDEAGFNQYMLYATILAALGEYDQIKASIEQLDDPQAEVLINGYIVYYDAVLQRSHLTQSLKDAADRMERNSAPHVYFYLALGYQLAGDSVAARKTCLTSTDPLGRFTACSYMSASLGMIGDDDATFYLDEAERALSEITDHSGIDPYTLMIQGRALALAGRVKKATEVYTQLNGQIEAMYVGSVLAKQLRDTGHIDIEAAIIRDSKSKFAAFRKRPERTDYLYNCYGDFLITLELYDVLNAELRRTTDPLLKANLLLGGAQALADDYMYRR